jgi:hypothetical protein
LDQMTLWLQRQEALHLRSSYISWRLQTDGRTAATAADDDSDSESEAEDDNPPLPTDQRPQYWVAKKCPLPQSRVSTIQDEYGASEFLPALELWLKRNFPRAPQTSKHIRFDLYHQVNVSIPSNPVTGSKIRHDRVRTTVAKPSSARRKKATPASFDTVLVNHQSQHHPRNSSSSSSTPPILEVAQVRAIFNLPRVFGSHAHPLAYVELFTPLHGQDPLTRMWRTSRATSNHCRKAAIISVDSIVRLCHLTPQCGAVLDRRLTTDNVLEECKRFFLNHRIDPDIFFMFNRKF